MTLNRGIDQRPQTPRDIALGKLPVTVKPTKRRQNFGVDVCRSVQLMAFDSAIYSAPRLRRQKQVHEG